MNVACEFPVRFDPKVKPGSLFTDPKYPTFFVVAGEVTAGEERSVMEVYELQPAGKKRMTAEEFLRGYPIQDGYRFGPEVLT